MLSKEEYYELLKVMGLEISSNKLLPKGPIAIKSRKEVIEVIMNHLKKGIKVNLNYLQEIFKEVHRDFSKELISLFCQLHQLTIWLSSLKKKISN